MKHPVRFRCPARVLRAAVALAAAGCLLASHAAGQQESASISAARALGTSDVDAYLDGRYEQAADELEKAYVILRVPSLALWAGRALDKRGRLIEAAEHYTEAPSLQVPSGDAQIQKQAVADCAAELAKLRARIPTISLELVGATAEEVAVSIDGKPVPASLVPSARLVNPGRHDIVATRGVERVSESATLSEGQQRRVTLRFALRPLGSAGNAAPAPSDGAAPASSGSAAPASSGGVLASGASTRDTSVAAGKSSQRLWAGVALVAGGAGLALGGITGGLAMSKRSELVGTGKCNDGCAPSLSSDVDRLNSYRLISTIGFIAGGALAAGGVVLWFTAPSPSGAQARAELLPNGFALKGNF